jgi:hypothetical protein
MGKSLGGAFLPNADYNTTGTWAIRHLKLPGTEYSASGIIPPVAGTAILTKATAATMTLPAPTLANNGAILIITSQTAAAHTVTGLALLADGVSGSPHGTATWAAFKGASLTLMAVNQLWNVIAATGVTIA